MPWALSAGLPLLFQGMSGGSRDSAAAGRNGVPVTIKGRRILVVEDEIMVATDLAYSLEDAGAEPIGPAYSLSEGLAIADRESVDAAILDVNLHGVDVYPLAERLLSAGVPFVFHTGHGDRETLTSRFPGATVCHKPTLPERLIAEVARKLG